MTRALIVEDDPQISELVEIHLKDLDFQIDTAFDGLDGLKKAIDNEYDLFILDIMLPRLDGQEICKKIRSYGNTNPIIMLTAKSEEIDRVLGLETGADDYIVKPFSVREFKARVKAIMRRSFPSHKIAVNDTQTFLEFEGLNIDSDKRIVYKKDKKIELTAKEFDLLLLLAENPGKAFNRQSILNAVWGIEFEGLEHTVNSHINRIRAKIEDSMTSPHYILTAWGYGYRFNEEVSIRK